jgi:parallel beta-helix repeat protein
VTGYSSANYDVVVSNNMITDGTNHGIHVAGSRISVTGNIIDTVYASGIFFGDSSIAAPYGPSYQSVIANNIIRNAQNTISLGVHNFHAGAITGNVVSGTASAHAGIYLRESTHNTVTGNLAEGGLGVGYWVLGSTGNAFTGNLSRNNASYGYRIGMSDASATQSTYNTFTGNVSDGDGNTGFSEADATTNGVFSNNRIVANGASPYMAKASLTTVVNNVPLSGYANYDPASLAIGATATTTIPVPGAVLGDRAEVSVQAYTDMTISAVVSAADTVLIKVWNNTGGVRDMANSTFFVWVWQK